MHKVLAVLCMDDLSMRNLAENGVTPNFGMEWNRDCPTYHLNGLSCIPVFWYWNLHNAVAVLEGQGCDEVFVSQLLDSDAVDLRGGGHDLSLSSLSLSLTHLQPLLGREAVLADLWFGWDGNQVRGTHFKTDSLDVC